MSTERDVQAAQKWLARTENGWRLGDVAVSSLAAEYARVRAEERREMVREGYFHKNGYDCMDGLCDCADLAQPAPQQEGS